MFVTIEARLLSKAFCPNCSTEFCGLTLHFCSKARASVNAPVAAMSLAWIAAPRDDTAGDAGDRGEVAVFDPPGRVDLPTWEADLRANDTSESELHGLCQAANR